MENNPVNLKSRLTSNKMYCTVMVTFAVLGALLYPVVVIFLYLAFSLLSALPSRTIILIWQQDLFMRGPSGLELLLIVILTFGLVFFLAFSIFLPFAALISSHYRSLVRLMFSLAKPMFVNGEQGYILYLRSFRSDHWRPTSYSYRPSWISLNPFQGIMKFISAIRWRSEEIVASVLFRFSPLITCVEPRAKWQPDGSIRIPLKENEWKDEVLQLMKQSDFILIGIDSTDGLKWEREQIRKKNILDKTIFMCHNPDGSASYENLMNIGSEISTEASKKISNDTWFPCREYALSFFDGEVQLYSGREGFGKKSQILICIQRVRDELERVGNSSGRDPASIIEFFLLDFGATFLISAVALFGIVGSTSDIEQVQHEFVLVFGFVVATVCAISFMVKLLSYLFCWYHIWHPSAVNSNG